MDIYFNTVNVDKIREIEFILSSHSKFKPHFLNKYVVEVLSNDIRKVVKQKAIDAYSYWRLPVIVEHGALEIEYLNNFPGALSKPMWDLMNEKICSLIPKGESRNAKVISAVCYCNGKNIKTFIGETAGEISENGKGTKGFQFDPIFIPSGSTKTYAEMDLDEKMPYSQATKSYALLIDYLNKL
jgi:XTP/dITP diphosphohydrolase